MQPSSTPRREASAAAVWAPWLAAPLFALLPIGGCGLAGGLRSAVALAPATTAAGQDSTALGSTARVVPVVRMAGRQVASRLVAH